MSMKTPPSSTEPADAAVGEGLIRRPEPPQHAAHSPRPSLFAQWAWFVAKNVLGWVLILAAFVAGPFVPGPGGLPLFLIGFGLITFPGKRRLTARVLRGVPFRRDSLAYRRGAALTALLLPAAAIVYLMYGWHLFRNPNLSTGLRLAGTYVAAALLTWWAMLHATPLFNRLMTLSPRMRRRFRPWLRRRGIDLLPPRRRARFVRGRHDDAAGPTRDPDDEILLIHERHHTRLREFWTAVKPWLRRAAGVAITTAIFVWILKPIVRHWDTVRHQILAMNWWPVAAASVMFAAFLFAFRATTWRRILKGLGPRVPLAPATRIWSTSELARYLPGVIWQVIGRAYLAKPYGVSGRVCSTSQVLELTVFLLANVIVAVACLGFMGWRHADGLARAWLIAAGAMVPFLLVLLHPKVFYTAVNRILAKLKKEPIQRKLRFRRMLELLAWSVAGLLWQGLAIWLVVHDTLGLPLAKWWVVTGAYCLAWCAGFLAVWAPGGIGVREAVFIAAMEFALPTAVKHGPLADPQQRLVFLTFLSVLLRIWATAGELILAGISYLFDLPGALGRPGAKGVKAPRAAGRAGQATTPTSVPGSVTSNGLG